MKIIRLFLLGALFSLLMAVPSFSQGKIERISSQDIVKAVSQARGKVVVLNFWASWCGPCREEIPEIIALRKRIPEDKLLILGISLDTDPSDMAAFVAKTGFNYPVYMAGSDVAPAFSVRAIPRTVVYSPKGEMVDSEEGYATGEELEQLIKRFMGS